MNEVIYYDLKQKAGLSPSLSSHVAREIGLRIVSQNYKPGELIEDENALTEHYRVSRSVVRDAVKILVGKGLLEVRRGIGTRVNPRHSWGLFDDDVLAWSQSAPPKPDMLRKLMELRQTFEPKAARWAAERGSPASFQDIEAALDEMEASVDNTEKFIIADGQFHRAILRATDNDYLMALEGLVFSGLLSSLGTTNTNRADNLKSIHTHRAVFAAIASKDGCEAETQMAQLLDDAAARLLDRLAQSGADDSGNGTVGSKSRQNQIGLERYGSSARAKM